MNPALDCGIDPNDSLLVAYLPKLDAVLQETRVAEGTLMSLDGVALDIVGPKRVRWWQVRRAAGDEGMQLPAIVWQNRVSKFTQEHIEMFAGYPHVDGYKPYMRAYSHGPWICIEKEQLERVYGPESEGTPP